jgi:hypothetical protein
MKDEIETIITKACLLMGKAAVISEIHGLRSDLEKSQKVNA